MSKWIDQIWTAGEARLGNIVRRSVKTVERYASTAELEAEVKRRGFHMARIGDQYVIVCDRAGTIKVIC